VLVAAGASWSVDLDEPTLSVMTAAAWAIAASVAWRPDSRLRALPAPHVVAAEGQPPAEPPRQQPGSGSGRRSWLDGIRRRREDEPKESEPESPRDLEAAPQRPRLQAVETPPAEPAPPTEPSETPPQEADATVVRLASRRPPEPRAWNLWELESLARGQAFVDPARAEEWRYLFLHLWEFADAGGKLPAEFDGLVREAFGEIVEPLEPA